MSYERGGLVESYLELRWRKYRMKRVYGVLSLVALAMWAGFGSQLNELDTLAQHVAQLDLLLIGGLCLVSVALVLYLQGMLSSLVRGRALEEMLQSACRPPELVDTLVLHSAFKATLMTWCAMALMVVGEVVARGTLSWWPFPAAWPCYAAAFVCAPLWFALTGYASVFCFHAPRPRLVRVAFLVPFLALTVAAMAAPEAFNPGCTLPVMLTLLLWIVPLRGRIIDGLSTHRTMGSGLSPKPLWGPWNDHAVVVRENLREGRWRRGGLALVGRVAAQFLPAILVALPLAFLSEHMGEARQRVMVALAITGAFSILLYPALLWILSGWRALGLVVSEKEGGTWEVVLGTRLDSRELIRDWMTVCLAGRRWWFLSMPMIFVPAAYVFPMPFVWKECWFYAPSAVWAALAVLVAWMCGRLGALVGIWSGLSTATGGRARLRFLIHGGLFVFGSILSMMAGGLLGAGFWQGGWLPQEQEASPWILGQLGPGLAFLCFVLAANVSYARLCRRDWNRAVPIGLHPTLWLVVMSGGPALVEVLTCNHREEWAVLWLFAALLVGLWLWVGVYRLDGLLRRWSTVLVGGLGSWLAYHCLWVDRICYMFTGQPTTTPEIPGLIHSVVPGMVMAAVWFEVNRARPRAEGKDLVENKFPVLWLATSLVVPVVLGCLIRLTFTAPAVDLSKDPDYGAALAQRPVPGVALPSELKCLWEEVAKPLSFTNRYSLFLRNRPWIESVIASGAPISAESWEPVGSFLDKLGDQAELTPEQRRDLWCLALEWEGRLLGREPLNVVPLYVFQSNPVAKILDSMQEHPATASEAGTLARRLAASGWTRAKWNRSCYIEALKNETSLVSPTWSPAWWRQAEMNGLWLCARERALPLKSLDVHTMPGAYWRAFYLRFGASEPDILDRVALLRQVLLSGSQWQTPWTLPSGARAYSEPGPRYWSILGGRRTALWPFRADFRYSTGP